MRKTIAVLSLTAAVVISPLDVFGLTVNFGHAYAAPVAPSPQLVINGSVVTADTPFLWGGLHGNTLYAPARLVLSRLGYDLTWNSEEQSLQAAIEGQTVLHKPGSTTWLIDGYVFNFDDASLIRDGSTWLPVQPVAEALGQHLVWSPLTATLYVKSTLAASISETLSYGYTRLSYEGETKDGLRHGFGQLFVDGVLWYEGEFDTNQMNGYGKLYTDGRLQYEGGFVKNKPHGQATFYYPDGSSYIGEFRNGHQTGQGSFYDARTVIRYRGEWVNGLMEGHGEIFNAKGTMIYSGEVRQNRRHGYGVSYDEANKKSYDGQWNNNLRSGTGRSYTPDGKLAYVGQWSEDRKHGSGYAYRIGNLDWYEPNDKGELTKTSKPATEMTEVRYRNDVKTMEGQKLIYSGDVTTEGIPNGTGKLSKQGGLQPASGRGTLYAYRTYYEGQFVLGEMTGMGKYYDEQEAPVYEGQVVNGLRQGQGRGYENGVLVYDGEWNHNEKSGIGRSYTYDKAFTGASFEGQASLLMYEGRYIAGKLAEQTAVYKYYGNFKQGVPDGVGSVLMLHDYKNDSGPKSLDKEQGTAWLVYEGDFKAGVREGKGKLYENNTLVYEGGFAQGLRSGDGTGYENGMKHVGKYAADLKNGQGSIYDMHGTLRYQGNFKDGKKDGFGRAYTEFGDLSYEGNYKNDLKHGFGKLYSEGTVYYQGEFREDKTLSQYLNELKDTE
ncbi:stalk domain-containing protein [Paenibacillus validus]|uniref:stalk domain-containing protein n=1 Tax=Paenibacillus validus TaxID=44253 RepID=UPI000FDB396A|nr:stalk domain-containing protein [Paenibacillus validus]MED4604027.1 stalk domain-containing protein [Paenibacillus validus]MED4609320.1 stalk domain-containing protein [Paenibacillus validus]